MCATESFTVWYFNFCWSNTNSCETFLRYNFGNMLGTLTHRLKVLHAGMVVREEHTKWL